ncbi:FAD-binding protein [Halarchaeum sp. CBA1220]|uniref:FAD-binding and (Fe-S)-binding domain-containing protein n=1 Tax=Halarchaeum sp. CBA1220 TaxID=1853682 RepID=UPI000F3A85DD|nr:FAD-binding and (Fe-S)-binding domain-containing protein [Halarchaeum sp. CBA1220]QLC33655.1 FAD-binding protein [Halarchaeum sp. CBA1220]
MAIDPGEAADPAADAAANYDYASDDVERPDLAAALSRRVEGEVRFDSYSRELYATDASLYEVVPVGVVFPASTADVAAVVEYCAEEGIAVLPRGGGTSLAGQTVNEAVVLDFTRHMDAVRDVDAANALARAQPGVKLGRLNAALEDHDLKFAPDPAWGDKSALGGAIGNNSTGSHSLKYGKTDAYVEEVEAVLADGTVATFGEVSVTELRERADPDGDIEERVHAAVLRVLEEDAAEVRERYPDLKRNVSGYNLDVLVAEGTDASGAVDEDATVNLARLLAGSEGTLAIVTEATVSLEPIPETKSVALLTYDDVVTAVSDVEAVLEHDAAAVELIDDVLLELARDTEEFRDVVGLLPEGTGSVLLVEFYAADDEAGERKVADLLADRRPGVETAAEPADDRPGGDAPVRANDALEAHDAERRANFWKLRKSGLPILLSRTTDEKHVSFIEDCAVPPEHLAEYVRGFQEILAEHDTFASFYAHAGPGVLHVRPLVNTKSLEGVEAMQSIADDVTDLVVEYGGSVSGEHGDGRARTQWNRKLYGDALWETFRDLKSAYDPDWLLNPGQVCGYGDAEAPPAGTPARAEAVDMTEHHRYGPDYDFEAGFEPSLEWETENGFEGMVELCHGCGGCRGDQDTTGGVMCPTYRASGEEIQSTRGRANMLRQAMSGDLPGDVTDEAFVEEVLDLCIGCKGCARDCPSEVDMAKLKAEVEHEYHAEHGASLREKAFAHVDTLSRVGSALAPLSNAATRLPFARAAMEKLVGIAAERSLPTFRRETFRDWWAQRGPQVPERSATRTVVLFPDTYSNYSEPAPLKAAVRVLEAADVHVRVAERTDSGRPAHSKGFLDLAADTAAENVAELHPYISEDWDVVLVEPSDAVMVQHDYLDLLSGERVEAVADNTYGVLEYLDAFGLDERLDTRDPGASLTYHGHCHQKATKKDHHAVGVLRRAGYAVDPLDSGCCGMAGSFGYEAEHHSMSEAIAETLYGQIDDSPGDVVVAPGASCRTQLGDRDDDTERPPTPVEMLAAALD